MGVTSHGSLNSTDVAAVLRQTNAVATSMTLSVLVLAALVALRIVPGGIGPQLPPLLSDGLFFLGVLELILAPVLFRVLFRDLDSFQRATIITFALRESVGLYGFLLYLLSGEVMRSYTLCFAAIVAMIIAWPRRSFIEERGFGTTVSSC